MGLNEYIYISYFFNRFQLKKCILHAERYGATAMERKRKRGNVRDKRKGSYTNGERQRRKSV